MSARQRPSLKIGNDVENFLRLYKYTDSVANFKAVWNKFLQNSSDETSPAPVVLRRKGGLKAFLWVASFMIMAVIGWVGLSQLTVQQTERKKVDGEAIIVTLTVGDVSVQKMGSEKWRSVRVDDLLEMGDTIKTADNSYCELKIESRGIYKIDDTSQIYLAKLVNEGGNLQAQINLDSGEMALHPAKLKDSEKFEVVTSSAVVAVRGTKFSVKSDSVGNTEVAVAEGNVAMSPSIRSIDTAIQKGLVDDAASKAIYRDLVQPIEIKGGESAQLDRETVKAIDQAIYSALEDTAKKEGKITLEKLARQTAETVERINPDTKEIEKLRVRKSLKDNIKLNIQDNYQKLASDKEGFDKNAPLVASAVKKREIQTEDLEKIQNVGKKGVIVAKKPEKEDPALSTPKVDDNKATEIKPDKPKEDAVKPDKPVTPKETVKKTEVKKETPKINEKKVQPKPTVQKQEPKRENVPLNRNERYDTPKDETEKDFSIEDVRKELPKKQNRLRPDFRAEREKEREKENPLPTKRVTVPLDKEKPLVTEAPKSGNVAWETAVKLYNVKNEPLFYNNRIYVTEMNKLKIFSSKGELIKSVTVVSSGLTLTRPVVGNGMIYMGSDGGGVYAYSTSGALQWSSMKAGQQTFGASPTAAYGLVAVPSINNGIVIFDSAGKVIDTIMMSGGEAIYSAPLILKGGSLIVYATEKGEMFGYNISDKRQLWRLPAISDRAVYPLVGNDNIAVILSRLSGELIGVNPNNGNVVWKNRYGNYNKTDINPVYLSGKILLAKGSTLAVINAGSGALIAEETFNGEIISPYLSDKSVYVGTARGTLYHYNLSSRKIEWSYDTGAAISVVVGDNSGAYAVTDEKMLKILR